MSYTSKTEISADGRTWTLQNQSKGTKVKSAPAQIVGTGRIFGNSINLGPLVNSSANDYDPTVSADEQELYFTSYRLGGLVTLTSG